MDKNDFVFSCITGYAISGSGEGPENDGWRDRCELEQAEGYVDAIESGYLGEWLKDEFEACDGDFEAEVVSRMLQLAKQHDDMSGDEIRDFVRDQYAADALTDSIDE